MQLGNFRLFTVIVRFMANVLLAYVGVYWPYCVLMAHTVLNQKLLRSFYATFKKLLRAASKLAMSNTMSNIEPFSKQFAHKAQNSYRYAQQPTE